VGAPDSATSAAGTGNPASASASSRAAARDNALARDARRAVATHRTGAPAACLAPTPPRTATRTTEPRNRPTALAPRDQIAAVADPPLTVIRTTERPTHETPREPRDEADAAPRRTDRRTDAIRRIPRDHIDAPAAPPRAAVRTTEPRTRTTPREPYDQTLEAPVHSRSRPEAAPEGGSVSPAGGSGTGSVAGAGGACASSTLADSGPVASEPDSSTLASSGCMRLRSHGAVTSTTGRARRSHCVGAVTADSTRSRCGVRCPTFAHPDGPAVDRRIVGGVLLPRRPAHLRRGLRRTRLPRVADGAQRAGARWSARPRWSNSSSGDGSPTPGRTAGTGRPG
jgi:hypothetical protein